MYDTLFTALALGYLDTVESRAAGVPAANVCALLAMDSENDDRDSRICIVAEVRGDNRSLQVQLAAVVRSTAGRSTTDPWLDAVGNRLANREAFLAYISSQPLEKRAGYQIESITRPVPAKVQRNEHCPIETGLGVVVHITTI